MAASRRVRPRWYVNLNTYVYLLFFIFYLFSLICFHREYLGKIHEPDTTYNVIGNCNEVGVCIGETTWDGVALLSATPQKHAVIDYGSLMWITLQRAKSAREAIDVMTSLMDTYGYASPGELLLCTAIMRTTS